MPHFLIKKENIKANYIELINDENFFHLIKSLRIKKGEHVKFIDENKTVFEAAIKEITKNSLKAEIINKFKSERYLKKDIILIQSVLMNDAQNLLVANAVQTGVKEIHPVISDNVSVSINSLKNKVEKWTKIALENFKQCERADLPEIKEVAKLKDTISHYKKENVLIFAEKYENSTLNNCLKNVDFDSKIAIVIGPEGGFSEDEFNYFKENNYKLITLGNMIYKAPNAVIAAISNIISRIET